MDNLVKHIAIILARGGSKRLPRKNITPIQGMPMVAWTILAAIKSKQFDRVLVSTDDLEIAKIGLQYGADVPFLRDSFYDDNATAAEATLAALEQAENHWGESYDYVSQLMANCPLRDHHVISRAVTNFKSGNADSQISCFKFGWMNPWWAVTLNEVGQPSPLFVKEITMRSQDLPKLFCPTGAIWVAKTSPLKIHKTFYLQNSIFFPMDWVSAIDVDDIEDLEMADYFLKKLNSLPSK